MTTMVVALYKFTPLEHYETLREPWLHYCLEQGVKGTLLLAQEGVNGTIAGEPDAMTAVLSYLRREPLLADFEYKTSYTSSNPFYRMKVKLKREIVTLGVAGVDPNELVGSYVEPSDWNDLMADPDVVLVDTRNDYECEVGTFKGAINPNTTTFREFPEYVKKRMDPHKHKKVAMFCTGGIRCEKATSYMKQQGFDEVYHLKGGILKYLEEVPKADSQWQGECFVFDNRVTVNHDLQPGSFDLCHGCRRPISETDKRSSDYMPGVSCPQCIDVLTAEQKRRFEERQQQIELAKQRGESHLGPKPDLTA